MNTYWVANNKGETLVEQQCRGMGSLFSFCAGMADEFTLEEATRLAGIYGGKVVRAWF